MKPEQLLWALVKQYFPGHVMRIENAAGVGTPDVHYIREGSSVWVELKVDILNKNLPVLDLLRPEQKVWHYKHVREVGKVYVLVRCGMKLTLYKAGWPKMGNLHCEYIEVWSDKKPWSWTIFEATLRSL